MTNVVPSDASKPLESETSYYEWLSYILKWCLHVPANDWPCCEVLAPARGEIYYVTMLSYSNEGHWLPIQICWMLLSVPLSHKVIILRHKCKEYLIAGKDYLQVTTIPVAQQWHSLYTRHMHWLQYTGNFWSMFWLQARLSSVWPPTPTVCVCRTIVFILTMIIVCARFIGLCSDMPVL